ncbi:MAG TPA: flagellar assembly peptidoglycan hydrolase FlgJ, partial [Spongiibacteraceae bacterium]|nr:flagellar assembly peptidoglycan hydrolase FlgJ [Spongiibacteraceae bacterium]
LSLSLSKGRGFGIAEALVRQLSGRLNIGKDATAKNSDHSLDATTRTQSAAAADASAHSGDSHMATAIQETLHDLFGGASATSDDKSSTAAPDGTPAKFVESLRPLAQRVGAALGVDSDLLLSQAALETGWGQKVLQCADGSSSFNFFNIKAGDSWRGAVVKVPTVEYQNGVAVREWANFRAYSSPEECFADYARLVGGNPRYQQALDKADDPRAYIKALADAGYATDPRYAQKVLAVFDGNQLTPTLAEGK